MVAVDMGYGHLRAAAALADAAGVEVRRGDRAPLAGPLERRAWRTVRGMYDVLVRRAGAGPSGGPFRRLLTELTAIPPPGEGTPESGRGAARWLRMLAAGGLCGGVLRVLPAGAPLVSTFYAHAIVAADRGRERAWCVVTDTDVHRVWAPLRPEGSGVRYCVPAEATAERLRGYGVPAEHILVTGFPLPPERLGGRDLPILRRELAARLARLDHGGTFLGVHGEEIAGVLGVPPEGPPRAPLVAFCVGGSGAQAGALRHLIPAAAEGVRAGRLRLLLVAGARPEVAARFRKWLRRAGLAEGADHGVEVLVEDDFPAYAKRFHGLLGDVDVLWTKPSEMTFFAGLGIPLLLAPSLGAHEERNRERAMEAGAAIDTPRANAIPELVRAALVDGRLARAAWAGFRGFPADGTYRILDAIGE